MRYPIISSSDANTHLSARRAGSAADSEHVVKYRGEGEELNQDFIPNLRKKLMVIRNKYPNGAKSPTEGNGFEGEAARAIHEAVPDDAQVLADPDFWIWLAVAHFSDTVEWRYGNATGGVTVANYGVGARNENLLFRLWLRAELVLDEEAKDRYHLCGLGQIDFYRSHLFRQGYANARTFARALLRYQYSEKDPASPRLKVGDIRELVKRLRRLRANLFLEILDETECRKVIETEAAIVLPAA